MAIDLLVSFASSSIVPLVNVAGSLSAFDEQHTNGLMKFSTSVLSFFLANQTYAILLSH
jgi:hypothetical protein